MMVEYCDVVAEKLGLDASGCETDHTIVDAYMNHIEFVSRVQT